MNRSGASGSRRHHFDVRKKSMFERSFTISASLVVFGGAASIPAMVADNAFWLILVLGAVEIVYRIERSSEIEFPVSARVSFSVSPWIGSGAVFHLVHGEWDYQGAWIALIASPATLLMMHLCRGYQWVDDTEDDLISEDGADQPATAPESRPEGEVKPKSESEEHSQ